MKSPILIVVLAACLCVSNVTGIFSIGFTFGKKRSAATTFTSGMTETQRQEAVNDLRTKYQAWLNSNKEQQVDDGKKRFAATTFTSGMTETQRQEAVNDLRTKYQAWLNSNKEQQAL